jgi:ribosome-binding protein aMBF1 (putative translation factor)|tara:strand:+ start:547 stop:882 length:336 start_codon:yes stop_codon:yes gene_type:complete
MRIKKNGKVINLSENDIKTFAKIIKEQNEKEETLEKTDYVSIGEQIRKERLKQNLSQQELADKVNMTQNALSKVEDGLATPIHMKLFEIQDVLGVEFTIKGKKLMDYFRNK